MMRPNWREIVAKSCALIEQNRLLRDVLCQKQAETEELVKAYHETLGRAETACQESLTRYWAVCAPAETP